MSAALGCHRPQPAQAPCWPPGCSPSCSSGRGLPGARALVAAALEADTDILRRQLLDPGALGPCPF
ncbi:MAG: hypothetical protein M3469_03050 [Actinomycetota bacterium]|nr:hypothetical protein [Actinomycetota bacterium]